ncbi:hypothetical protein ACFLZH_04445 [Patescibacteria group bacterium]
MNPPKSPIEKHKQAKIMSRDKRSDFLIEMNDHVMHAGKRNNKEFSKIKAVAKSPAKLAAFTKIPVDSITKVFKSTDLKTTYSQFQEAVGNEYTKFHNWITQAKNKARGVQRYDDAYNFEVNLEVKISKEREALQTRIKQLTTVLVQAIKRIIKKEESK